MRLAVLIAAAALLAGCGSHKPGAYEQANLSLLGSLPVYPGATGAKTSSSGTGDVEFSSRDWTLPAAAKPDAVITWYEQKLQAAGWKLSGKSFDTLRGTRRGASLSVGVRGRTLEAVANSRGA